MEKNFKMKLKNYGVDHKDDGYICDCICGSCVTIRSGAYCDCKCSPDGTRHFVCKEHNLMYKGLTFRKGMVGSWHEVIESKNLNQRRHHNV